MGPAEREHPSVLARMLAAGELDVALVPTFEVLRAPVYQLVDGVAIACDGPVFSVVKLLVLPVLGMGMDPLTFRPSHW